MHVRSSVPSFPEQAPQSLQAPSLLTWQAREAFPPSSPEQSAPPKACPSHVRSSVPLFPEHAPQALQAPSTLTWQGRELFPPSSAEQSAPSYSRPSHQGIYFGWRNPWLLR